MRGIVGAIALACLLVGCGGSESSAGQAAESPSGLYTGSSDQGLAVSVQADGGRGVLAFTWVGRCAGAPYRPATVGLTDETFRFDELPASLDDRRRVPGDDSDASTYLRHIELRADGAGISGRFRIRKREYNGQGRAVDALCDSGEVGFSATSVPKPQLPPVTATQDDFREATFQELISEALASLDFAIEDRDPRAFCGQLTARLKRTFCKAPKATIDRIVQLTFLNEAGPAWRPDRRAVVVFQTGDVSGTAAGITHGVRTLRFSGSNSKGWRLDRVGPRRQAPGPG